MQAESAEEGRQTMIDQVASHFVTFVSIECGSRSLIYSALSPTRKKPFGLFFSLERYIGK